MICKDCSNEDDEFCLFFGESCEGIPETEQCRAFEWKTPLHKQVYELTQQQEEFKKKFEDIDRNLRTLFGEQI